MRQANQEKLSDFRSAPESVGSAQPLIPQPPVIAARAFADRMPAAARLPGSVTPALHEAEAEEYERWDGMS